MKELTGSSYWAINGDDGSIMEALGKIKQNISKAASLDKNLEDSEQNLIDAIERLRDVGSELRDYSQNLDNDTERLNEIQERLFMLDKLKRKYGGTLAEVISTGERLAQELAGIEFSTQNIEELEKECARLNSELTGLAGKITEKRKDYAKVLSVYIQENLNIWNFRKPDLKFLLRLKLLPKMERIMLNF